MVSWLAPFSPNGNSGWVRDVVAVGVVVGAGLPEVGQRGDDVGRVLAQVVELGLGVVELRGSCSGKAVPASCASAGVCLGSAVRSPLPAGLWIRSVSAPTVGIDAVGELAQRAR